MPFFSHFFRNAAAGLIAACCLGPASGLEAQSIPVSHAFKTAEARGTRSQTGLPGKNYWQNQASYDIRLRVHPPDRLITGTERIVYRNLSPDTLREIHLKLIQNAHRPGAHRDQPVDSGYFNQGFHLHSLTLGKTGIDPARLVTAPGHNRTWEILPLSNPLAPGDSILLGISWDYTLSDSKTTEPRDGVVDSTTFFLAYFYPRVDVYDDVEGWNGQDFTELQEFYNDFSSYRVSVTVPDSYIVWATGNLLDRRITGLLAGLQADGSIHRIMD
ncbi:MAG TPA: hypothetical protein VMV20_06925, partial [Chitinophagaceae bacterium]|nr:hypothetical protein [Chitinophagaceae bacterium]